MYVRVVLVRAEGPPLHSHPTTAQCSVSLLILVTIFFECPCSRRRYRRRYRHRYRPRLAGVMLFSRLISRLLVNIYFFGNYHTPNVKILP